MVFMLRVVWEGGGDRKEGEEQALPMVVLSVTK